MKGSVATTIQEIASEPAVDLYRRAFKEFGSRALWNIRQYDLPTVAQIRAITRPLRTEGDLAARRLAEDIERETHAHH
jgi:hypothetical protein